VAELAEGTGDRQAPPEARPRGSVNSAGTPGTGRTLTLIGGVPVDLIARPGKCRDR
jgi:hypothetical protein